jgi:hypothetical protein
MSRLYELTLTNPAGQILALSPSGFLPSTTGQPTFTSRKADPRGNGGMINNPGALCIEFDMPVAPYATPQGLQSVRLRGIGLRQIGQSANLNPNPAAGTLGAGFKLVGGMAPGLPLATACAAQKGLLVQGTVAQAFGNWQGVNQTLEFKIQPADLTPEVGIPFNWSPKTLLSTALYASLTAAFPPPQYKVKVNISSALVQSLMTVSVPGHYHSLGEFADMISRQTQAMGTRALKNDYYPGVQIAIQNNSIYAYDGTSPLTTKVTHLAFTDLIGQPTWIDPNTVNFKTVLRGDIQVGSQITFPTVIQSPYALTSATAAIPGAPASSSSAFKGTFLVQEVHHFGNSRQADADSWCTTFNVVPTGDAS